MNKAITTADDRFPYVQNPKKSTGNLAELIR